jgi:organic radical activating enzyme
MIWDTWGLCNECYGIVPARTDGVIFGKICPEHGYQQTEVDPEPGFYERVQALPRIEMKNRMTHTSLSVTDRCNLRCPGCYARPDDTPDQPISEIVKVAITARGQALALMGSEPTMRDDLAEMIRVVKAETHKPVAIYTNGIRLEDESYLAGLIEAGLDRCVISLHLPNYVGQKAFNSKIKAIANINKTGVKLLDQVVFSLKSVTEIKDALKYIMTIDFKQLTGGYVRLRAPAEVGGDRNEPTSMSAMLNGVQRACEHLGYNFKVAGFSNHMYAIMVVVQGKPILIIRWPTVAQMDLEEIQKGPRTALFVPQIGETQILHQGYVTERIRSGHPLPPPPPKDAPDYIRGYL